MNVLMMTNTYLPHVGGVAQSVHRFAEAYRRKGHRVLVVAPEFPGREGQGHEPHVVRVPAIQRFNGSDFSVRLPVPGLVSDAADRFEPDIVHTHHPFLLGDTALRLAQWRALPLVFTHHTLYERYTHYVPADSPAMRRFAVGLATEFANLCDHVIAPSRTIADLLRDRGVHAPLSVVPTGVDADAYRAGDRRRGRRALGLDDDAMVIGHVGRLAAEKNLGFLTDAVARAMVDRPGVHWLVVGDGPFAKAIDSALEAEAGLRDRLHMPGRLTGDSLIDAYHAMDLFAFASTSETQGMVVAEAMAAGLPVVALDAPGVREVVEDRVNGRLLDEEKPDRFADALREVIDLGPDQRAALREGARRTAEAFSTDATAEKALTVYDQARERADRLDADASGALERLRGMIELEWDLWSRRAGAAADAIRGRGAAPTDPDDPDEVDDDEPTEG